MSMRDMSVCWNMGIYPQIAMLIVNVMIHGAGVGKYNNIMILGRVKIEHGWFTLKHGDMQPTTIWG